MSIIKGRIKKKGDTWRTTATDYSILKGFRLGNKNKQRGLVKWKIFDSAIQMRARSGTMWTLGRNGRPMIDSPSFLFFILTSPDVYSILCPFVCLLVRARREGTQENLIAARTDTAAIVRAGHPRLLLPNKELPPTCKLLHPEYWRNLETHGYL